MALHKMGVRLRINYTGFLGHLEEASLEDLSIIPECFYAQVLFFFPRNGSPLTSFMEFWYNASDLHQRKSMLMPFP